MVVEVMGRYAGWIALSSGLAGRADAILIPEIPYSIDNVAADLKRKLDDGKPYAIVVVAEGAKPKGGDVTVKSREIGRVERLGGVGETVADQLQQLTGQESRSLVLGHLLRGGSPTAIDRNLGVSFGAGAVFALNQGMNGVMVALKPPNLNYVPLARAIAKLKLVPPDGEMVLVARALDISFGDRPRPVADLRNWLARRQFPPLNLGRSLFQIGGDEFLSPVTYTFCNSASTLGYTTVLWIAVFFSCGDMGIALELAVTGMVPMNSKRSLASGLLQFARELTAILCIGGLIPGGIPAATAQTQAPASADQSAATLPADQLDSLVAPIALYPDPLLSQVLVASTYPLEVVQLQQWLAQNKGMDEKKMAEAVKKQDWDPSIQGLAALPDAVKLLSENIKWTTDLGNAFLAQQKDVMDAVQRMRKKAQESGNLKSSEQVKVETKTVESTQVIVVEQANPQVVYVPSYNPTVVYGAPVYAYPPIAYPPVGYYAAGMAISFGVGVAMGAMWGGGWGYDCGWGATTTSPSTTTTTSSTTAIGTTSTAATGTTSTAAIAATATGSTIRSIAAEPLTATEVPPISTAAPLAATPCSLARTTLARTRRASSPPVAIVAQVPAPAT